MLKIFDFNEKIILVLLGLTFVLRLQIPFGDTISSIVFFIESILFIFIVLSSLGGYQYLKSGLRINLLFEVLLILSFVVFLFATFITISQNSSLISLFKIFSYLVIVVSFFFVFANSIYNDADKFEAFLDIIMYLSIFLSIVGICFFIIGFHPIKMYSSTTTGIFAHPNTASMFYTIAIPVVAYKFFTKKLSFPQFFIIMLILIFCLLFTFSRAGYIGVGVGLLLITFYRSKVLFFLTLLFLFLAVSTFVLDMAVAKSDSSVARLMLILTAIQLITKDQNTLLWGYGTSDAYKQFQKEKFLFGNEAVLDPHNIFLLMALEFGIVLTILLVISFFVLLINTFFLRFKNPSFKSDLRLNLSVTIVIALFAQNFLEDMLIYTQYFFMPTFLIFLGYLYYTYKNRFVNSSKGKPAF
ncbi:MAG: O-antigen ligase family protein [Ignavibacteriae bacterium]|nr:O-antigen ligase family protein [Ignavibacteriota bacterium]MCB9244401.1 O-antigen ligase family protein [Ignavibacteriales bacterium]